MRVELDGTSKKSDTFPPFSQLELPLGLVEACPTRLPQLVAEFRGAFTKKGQLLFEDLVAKGNFGSGGEVCVMGTSAVLGRALEPDARDQLKSLYYRQYADAWRDFLGSFKVIPYKGPEDAAHRLSILDGPRNGEVIVSGRVPRPPGFRKACGPAGSSRNVPAVAQTCNRIDDTGPEVGDVDRLIQPRYRDSLRTL